MNSRWMERAEALNAAVADRWSDASDRVKTGWRAANDVLGNGAGYARDVGRSLRVTAQRGGLSTRELIAERPIESVLIVGAVGFAVGWLWRRSREARVDAATPARANGARRPPARSGTRASRSRAASASAD